MNDPTMDEMRIEVLKWMGYGEPYEEGKPYRPIVLERHPLTLDWLHECAGKLTDAEHFYFRQNLKAISRKFAVALPATFEERENDRAYHSATAQQRLLALWRTIKGL